MYERTTYQEWIYLCLYAFPKRPSLSESFRILLFCMQGRHAGQAHMAGTWEKKVSYVRGFLAD